MPSVRGYAAVDPAARLAKRPGYEWICRSRSFWFPRPRVVRSWCLLRPLRSAGVGGLTWEHALLCGRLRSSWVLLCVLVIWELGSAGTSLKRRTTSSSSARRPVALCVPGELVPALSNGRVATADSVRGAGRRSRRCSARPGASAYRLHGAGAQRGGFDLGGLMAVRSALAARRAIQDDLVLQAAWRPSGSPLVISPRPMRERADTMTASVFVRATPTSHNVVSPVDGDAADRVHGVLMVSRRVGTGVLVRPAQGLALNGIQSTYLWGITWIGLDMPHVGGLQGDVAANGGRRARPRVVGQAPGCRGGPEALQEAGYSHSSPWPDVALTGRERVWVRVTLIPSSSRSVSVTECVLPAWRSHRSRCAAGAATLRLELRLRAPAARRWSAASPHHDRGGVPTLHDVSARGTTSCCRRRSPRTGHLQRHLRAGCSPEGSTWACSMPARTNGSRSGYVLVAAEGLRDRLDGRRPFQVSDSTTNGAGDSLALGAEDGSLTLAAARAAARPDRLVERELGFVVAD